MRPIAYLAPAACRRGTVTYRKLDDGFYEAIRAGKSETGAFKIVESIAYDVDAQTAFRHV